MTLLMATSAGQAAKTFVRSGVAIRQATAPLEAGGEDHGAGRPRDDHARVLEGLAERLEHPRGELGQLVQEEDAVVGQADLSGMRNASAADEAGLRGGVMRGAERPGREQSLARSQQAGHAPDGGGLDCLLKRERRQDGGDAAGQHRLAGPGRPDHQHGRINNHHESYVLVLQAPGGGLA
jgi:hypothetical protein